MEQINKELMEAGYLCPNQDVHEWKLLEWEGNIRNMKCEKYVLMGRDKLKQDILL